MAPTISCKLFSYHQSGYVHIVTINKYITASRLIYSVYLSCDLTVQVTRSTVQQQVTIENSSQCRLVTQVQLMNNGYQYEFITVAWCKIQTFNEGFLFRFILYEYKARRVPRTALFAFLAGTILHLNHVLPFTCTR